MAAHYCSDSATTPALPAAHQLTSLLVHRRGEGALPGRRLRFMVVSVSDVELHLYAVLRPSL